MINDINLRRRHLFENAIREQHHSGKQDLGRLEIIPVLSAPPTNGNITNNFLGRCPADTQLDTTNKADLNLTAKDNFYVVIARGKWSTDYTG